MIEFHESEYNNALSDRSMRLVALLLGPESVTRLRYRGDKYARLYRLDPARDRTANEERSNTYDDSGPFDIWHTEDSNGSESITPSEEAPPMARIG